MNLYRHAIDAQSLEAAAAAVSTQGQDMTVSLSELFLSDNTACFGPWLTAIAMGCECGLWASSADDQRQDDLAVSSSKGLGLAGECEVLPGAELVAGHAVMAVPA